MITIYDPFKSKIGSLEHQTCLIKSRQLTKQCHTSFANEKCALVSENNPYVFFCNCCLVKFHVGTRSHFVIFLGAIKEAFLSHLHTPHRCQLIKSRAKAHAIAELTPNISPKSIPPKKRSAAKVCPAVSRS